MKNPSPRTVAPLELGLVDWLACPSSLVIEVLDNQCINAFAGTQFRGQVHIVRLDKTHPIISGNKWFKLKYVLVDILERGISEIVSFGGPYSNHLHALGYAAQVLGLSMTAIIRGETVSNPMISDLDSWGVQCRFVDRLTYRSLCRSVGDFDYDGIKGFAIPEGGADTLSLKGCGEITQALNNQLPNWDYLLCAMGTGATLAGLISTQQYGQIIGMPALKQGEFLRNDVNAWLDCVSGGVPNWSLDLEGHYGGFGKIKPELLDFMNKYLK